MRIGIDVRPLLSPVRAGVGEYTSELLSALFSLNLDHEYVLVSSGMAGPPAEVGKWQAENIISHHIKWPNKLLHFSQSILHAPPIDRLVGELDCWVSPNVGFTTLSPRLKQIQVIHDLSFEIMPDCYSLKRRLWHRFASPRAACERANAVVVPSEHTKHDVCRQFGIQDEAVHVIHPGIAHRFFHCREEEMAQAKASFTLPERFVFFLGTIEPRKNIESLVHAFDRSSLRADGYELVIAGAPGWSCRGTFDLIAQTPGVRYLGYVDSAHQPALYRLASLFVYPSLYEGFGFPVLEAMAAGTPVITSNRSSLPEVAGNAALLVDPYNADEIGRAMKQLLNDTALYRRYAARGPDQARQFQWRAAAQTFSTLL